MKEKLKKLNELKKEIKKLEDSFRNEVDILQDDINEEEERVKDNIYFEISLTDIEAIIGIIKKGQLEEEANCYRMNYYDRFTPRLGEQMLGDLEELIK